MTVNWDIRRTGRAWDGEEFEARWELTPEKFEVYDGKLLWYENDRVNLLGLLLEQVGMDVAVRLGRLETWEAAIAACRDQPRELVSRQLGWKAQGDEEG